MVFAGFGCSIKDLNSSAQIIYQYTGTPVVNHGYSVNMTCKHGYLLNTNKGFLINICTQKTLAQTGHWNYQDVVCTGMYNLFINFSLTHSLKINMAFTVAGHVFSCHLCIFYIFLAMGIYIFLNFWQRFAKMTELIDPLKVQYNTLFECNSVELG